MKNIEQLRYEFEVMKNTEQDTAGLQ